MTTTVNRRITNTPVMPLAGAYSNPLGILEQAFIDHLGIANYKPGRLCAKAKKPDYIYNFDSEMNLTRAVFMAENGKPYFETHMRRMSDHTTMAVTRKTNWEHESVSFVRFYSYSRDGRIICAMQFRPLFGFFKTDK